MDSALLKFVSTFVIVAMLHLCPMVAVLEAVKTTTSPNVAVTQPHFEAKLDPQLRWEGRGKYHLPNLLELMCPFRRFHFICNCRNLRIVIIQRRENFFFLNVDYNLDIKLPS